MYQSFQQISAMESCFPALAFSFSWGNSHPQASLDAAAYVGASCSNLRCTAHLCFCRPLELSTAVERLKRFERLRLLIQRTIAEQFGSLDKGLVSHDHRAI